MKLQDSNWVSVESMAQARKEDALKERISALGLAILEAQDCLPALSLDEIFLLSFSATNPSSWDQVPHFHFLLYTCVQDYLAGLRSQKQKLEEKLADQTQAQVAKASGEAGLKEPPMEQPEKVPKSHSVTDQLQPHKKRVRSEDPEMEQPEKLTKCGIITDAKPVLTPETDKLEPALDPINLPVKQVVVHSPSKP